MISEECLIGKHKDKKPTTTPSTREFMVKAIKVITGTHLVDNRTQGSQASAKEGFAVTPKHYFIV